MSDNTFFLSPDYTKSIPKPVTYLCKPDKKVVASFYNEIEPTISYKLNNINELTFNIPVFVEDGDYFKVNSEVQLIKNPHIDLIQPRYLLLVEFNNTKEYFQINSLTDTGQDKDYIAVQCYSLGYKLKDTKLINYNTVSSTLRQILLGNDNDNTKGILHSTDWTVGYIDPKYKDIYRGFENYSGTVLQAILDLETTFEYIVEFDTENQLLNFYYKENYGKESNLTFDYEHYLKTFTRERNADADSMCTRLRLYGKDNLSVESYNPTGQDYIEDYTYFMYPFEMDKQGNILKHSYYMSDELCIAITKRMAEIIQNQGKYFNLYNKKNTYSELKIYKNQELDSLNNQLQIFASKLVVSRDSGNSTKEILDIKLQIESDITNKKEEIEEINNISNDIDTKMNNIVIDLSEENNFTNSEIQELYKYVIWDKLEDTNYINDKDLYQYGLKQMLLKNKPRTTIKTDFINFLECIEEQFTWDKIKLGDKIHVQYPLLNINSDYQYGVDEFNPNDMVGDL